MAFDITINENYIYVYNGVNDVFDRPAKDVVFAKKNIDSDRFTIYYRGLSQRGYEDIIWSDFTLNGSPFASLQAFEDWKNEKTGFSNGGGNGGGVASFEERWVIFQGAQNNSWHNYNTGITNKTITIVCTSSRNNRFIGVREEGSALDRRKMIDNRGTYTINVFTGANGIIEIYTQELNRTEFTIISVE